MCGTLFGFVVVVFKFTIYMCMSVLQKAFYVRREHCAQLCHSIYDTINRTMVYDRARMYSHSSHVLAQGFQNECEWERVKQDRGCCVSVNVFFVMVLGPKSQRDRLRLRLRRHNRMLADGRRVP